MASPFPIKTINTGDDQINIGLLFVLAAVTVLIVVAVVVFTIGLYDHWRAVERAEKQFAVTEAPIVTGVERNRLEATQLQSINEYGWADERLDRARIPIDEAKALYARQLMGE